MYAPLHPFSLVVQVFQG